MRSFSPLYNSEYICPSFKNSTREQKLAATESCVTIIIVTFFSLLIFSKLLSNAVADLESKAPVGSSAKTIEGLPTRALAAEVLCFCPPEISLGYLFKISLIPKDWLFPLSFSLTQFSVFSLLIMEEIIFSLQLMYPASYNPER